MWKLTDSESNEAQTRALDAAVSVVAALMWIKSGCKDAGMERLLWRNSSREGISNGVQNAKHLMHNFKFSLKGNLSVPQRTQ